MKNQDSPIAQENEALRQTLAATNSLKSRPPATANCARAETPDAVALAAENAALRQQIKDRAAADKQAEADEEIIAQKMKHGLTRPQALSIIKNQRSVDEHRAKHILPAREIERAERARINTGIRKVYGLE